MSKFLKLAVGLLLFVGLVGASVWVFQSPQSDGLARGTLTALQADATSNNFSRATAIRDFVWPDDHGPHNDFQTEWWYYTGNLQDPTGRHFGYQFTIFRRALALDAPSLTQSDMAFNQIYFAHFALTDSAGNDHVAFEKYSRSAAGLAGAAAEPFQVFIEDWSITGVDQQSAKNVRIKAAQGDYAIDLSLAASKPIVLQGDRGLSRKSTEMGNASYYYSITRMRTQGKVRSKSGEFDVQGNSWMDREWSTSALSNNAVGWDWFAIQLDDGRDLTLGWIRNKDGSLDSTWGGSLVEADGTSRRVLGEDFQATVLETWRSPRTNAEYPIKWKIVFPKDDMTLEITARIPDQEMNLNQLYWEGATTINGTQAGKPLSGVGYLELTGYGGKKTRGKE